MPTGEQLRATGARRRSRELIDEGVWPDEGPPRWDDLDSGEECFEVPDDGDHQHVLIDGLVIPDRIVWRRAGDFSADVQVTLELRGRRLEVVSVEVWARPSAEVLRQDLDLDLPAIASYAFAHFAATPDMDVSLPKSAEDRERVASILRRMQSDSPPLDDVAAIYRANVDSNPSAAVRSAYSGWSPATVHRWIAQARDIGLLPKTKQFEKKA